MNHDRPAKEMIMRFKIEHPQDTSLGAAYGCDRALGYFVDIRPNESLGIPRVEYDAVSDGYDHQRPLRGALEVLIEYGFISREDLESALELVRYMDPEDMAAPARRCAEVVANFKSVAR